MKKIIYKLLELIYRNGFRTEVSGVAVKLPLRFSRYYEKNYEADNIRFFRQTVKPKDVILDIGAQIGLMTKLFSDLTGEGGKVYAFEPTPLTFNALKETIRINGIGKIAFPVPAAVTDKKGKATFNISGVEIDAANSLADYKRKHSASGIEVDTISIDDFFKEQSLSKLDFIKIDAEGAEYYVLLGASETMSQQKPIINLALHPLAISSFNSSLEEIYNFITAKNYEVFFKSKALTKEAFSSYTDLFDVQLMPKK